VCYQIPSSVGGRVVCCERCWLVVQSSLDSLTSTTQDTSGGCDFKGLAITLRSSAKQDVAFVLVRVRCSITLASGRWMEGTIFNFFRRPTSYQGCW
jgi:hypothetical protein